MSAELEPTLGLIERVEQVAGGTLLVTVRLLTGYAEEPRLVLPVPFDVDEGPRAGLFVDVRSTLTGGRVVVELVRKAPGGPEVGSW